MLAVSAEVSVLLWYPWGGSLSHLTNPPQAFRAWGCGQQRLEEEKTHFQMLRTGTPLQMGVEKVFCAGGVCPMKAKLMQRALWWRGRLADLMIFWASVAVKCSEGLEAVSMAARPPNGGRAGCCWQEEVWNHWAEGAAAWHQRKLRTGGVLLGWARRKMRSGVARISR